MALIGRVVAGFSVAALLRLERLDQSAFKPDPERTSWMKLTMAGVNGIYPPYYINGFTGKMLLGPVPIVTKPNIGRMWEDKAKRLY